MNVPFDNLYEYIAGEHPDTIIYRWYPHGSKNLADLAHVDHRYQQLAKQNWIAYNHLIPVVCHDQEPLHFDLYEHVDHSVLTESTKAMLGHDPSRYQQWCHNQNLFCAVDSSLSDRAILLHSEHRSSQVLRYQTHAVTAYWWSHAAIARDWYRFAEIDHRVIQQPQSFDFDFNIYARAWQGSRQYRLTFLSMLLQKNLVPHCRITFKHHDEQQHFSNMQFDNPSFFVDPGLCTLDESDVDSDASSRYDVNHIQTCAVDVVLETLFDDDRVHLTEKILRSIACGKPFLLAAPPHSLAYLRSYGFRTFDGVINEQYDLILDPVLRLQAIADEMCKIAALSPEAKQQFYLQCQEIAQHNRQHFFSDTFIKHVFDELNQNLQAAKQQVYQRHLHGNQWLARWKLLYSSQSHKHRQWWKLNAPCSIEQVAEFLQHVRKINRAAPDAK